MKSLATLHAVDKIFAACFSRPRGNSDLNEATRLDSRVTLLYIDKPK